MKKKRKTPSKKRNFSPKTNTKKALRWTFSLIVSFLLLFWIEPFSNPVISDSETLQLYSNQSDDDLRSLYLTCIQKAEESISLYSYSLTDRKVIKALNDKAKAGIAVKVFHDAHASPEGYALLDKSIQQTVGKVYALMHKKILLVDGQIIVLGSANLTYDSFRKHANLVSLIYSKELARQIDSKEKVFNTREFIIGGQKVEWWSLPEDREDGLQRVTQLIDSAQKTIKVAMYTWTHPQLTDAIVKAHKRHVKVDLVLDASQAEAVCAKTLKALEESKIPYRLSSGQGLLHHKFALIDDRLLINGSTNWTKAAFTKNDDCFLVIHDLNEEQKEKMKRVWQTIRTFSKQAYPLKINSVTEKEKLAA